MSLWPSTRPSSLRKSNGDRPASRSLIFVSEDDSKRLHRNLLIGFCGFADLSEAPSFHAAFCAVAVGRLAVWPSRVFASATSSALPLLPLHLRRYDARICVGRQVSIPRPRSASDLQRVKVEEVSAHTESPVEVQQVRREALSCVHGERHSSTSSARAQWRIPRHDMPHRIAVTQISTIE